MLSQRILLFDGEISLWFLVRAFGCRFDLAREITGLDRSCGELYKTRASRDIFLAQLFFFLSEYDSAHCFSDGI